MSIIVSQDHECIKPALSEFQDVYRFYDETKKMTIVKLQPGECYVTKNTEAIETVLGSCISACVRDPVSGVGGMNHFMLPKEAIDSKISRRSLSNPELCYGNWAMEHLINSVLKHGGAKNRLQIKVFGGAKVLSGLTNLCIGDRNIEFVQSYLENDGWAIDSQDIGGTYARKIIFFPHLGNVKMKKMVSDKNDDTIKRETNYLNTLSHKKKNDVELF